MTPALILSIIALVTSIISVGFSIYFGLRDRPRLKTYCQLYELNGENATALKIKIVNVGRRPVLIRLLGRTFKDGWRGTYINGTNNGVRLGENDFYEETISPYKNMEILFDHEGEPRAEELWFEDSIGRRHIIKDSRKLLKKFWHLNKLEELTPNHADT